MQGGKDIVRRSIQMAKGEGTA